MSLSFILRLARRSRFPAGKGGGRSGLCVFPCNGCLFTLFGLRDSNIGFCVLENVTKRKQERPRKVSRNCSSFFSCFHSPPRLESSGALCVQSLRLRHSCFTAMQEFLNTHCVPKPSTLVRRVFYNHWCAVMTFVWCELGTSQFPLHVRVCDTLSTLMRISLAQRECDGVCLLNFSFL